MAFSQFDIIELQMVGLSGSGEIRNVWHYQISSIPSPTITASNVAEAWWNHMKATYRASIAVALGDFFQRIRCESMMSPTGDAGDFAVPAAEQPGTRSTPAGDRAPTFLAAGLRLNVTSRLTRPGQKRIYGLYESDFTGEALGTTFQALALAIATVQLPLIVLGAPAATLAINPMVARVPATLPVVTFQPWTSAQVANFVTTQNTRKPGRGS